MSTTVKGFHAGDEVRVYRDWALGAVETATVVRLTEDGAIRLRFRTDGHESNWRHGRIELATVAAAAHHYVA